VERDVGLALRVRALWDAVGRDQFFDQFSVMNHFVIPTELMIFSPNIVITVRAGDDDARRFDLVESLDVLSRQFKIQVFFSGG
jgi:hypothetical protein